MTDGGLTANAVTEDQRTKDNGGPTGPRRQMMPTIDRSKLPNAFHFVTVASARARQLLRGCTPRVDAVGRKTARIAEREVLTGVVEADAAPRDASGTP